MENCGIQFAHSVTEKGLLGKQDVTLCIGCRDSVVSVGSTRTNDLRADGVDVIVR